MKKSELITVFNTVQEKFEDAITEEFFLQRLKPYADEDGFVDYHKLAMFAHNESLASAKGFFFEVLSEILVDDDDVVLEEDLDEITSDTPEVTPE
ncbi:hypothetical protein LNN31_15770 [Acetobacterium wieringae]|jgi:hypothetical protein|uniref:Uncharacterized protein n=1 Tax=Acetobacterium wieringae TaxID=52694 RepID=A0A1F2PJ68_9FIRM|nr:MULTISPECIES: hypothetical protein [Acetobacterium]HAZ05131.1 hypothetical protein [Acetobacterium sp.]OFV71367.1 hypothetical protein ACWI_10960 [Acetobacterium wieringae]OXS26428.1 MAG: hypothetical protein BI182_15210 [Acetobacterium sp. MES1]URN83780.1 hypothetical protein CHL1_002938 [Acetobacterium wieringae]UYO62226.1 hypothetical protein LNN31_15770 [Acetobacterium wieringae]